MEYYITYNLAISIILGAIFGSFSTFVGFRLFNDNKKINLKSQRSICCNCGHTLHFLDLIPIISFCILNRKCRYCHEKIPIWHFLAEIFMTLSFVSATIFIGDINEKTTLLWLIYFCLITQSIIDYRVMMSSDVIHIITFVASIILSYMLNNSKYQIILMPCLMFSMFLLISFLMKKILKKDCLGFGDIKLFVSLSPLLSIEKIPIFFGLCGFFGICSYYICNHINKKKYNRINQNYIKNNTFPFIPAIFFAFLLAFYF